jgi:cytoskeleton protein RodZ
VTARPTANDFGGFLRQAREASGLSLDDVARMTRVRRGWLGLLESSDLSQLPAAVFVRGWVGAYARAVGADGREAARLLGAHMADVQAQSAQAEASRLSEAFNKLDSGGRRRVGFALAVIVLLIAATLMFSMLLRRPAPAAGPISRSQPPASTRLA